MSRFRDLERRITEVRGHANGMALALPTQPVPAVGTIGLGIMVVVVLAAGVPVLAKRRPLPCRIRS